MKLLASQKPTQNPQVVARDWVTAQCDGVDDIQDDWSGAMQRAGIKDEVRVPMLKSEHRFILYTQPLKAWLVEIIDTFYDTLVELEANILLKLSEPIPQLRGRGGDEDEAEYTVPQAPGGHFAVFKSVDGRHTKGCIKEDGTVSLGRLESYFNTDFARQGGLYFTHQIWVAKAYSRLINDACNVADRRTVELHVPLSHFKEVKTWDLKFGDEWKQILWYSRRGESLPKDMQKLKAQYGCIHGPIAHAHNDTIVKLKSWEQVAWKHVMTKEVEEEGKKQTLVAMQQVWMGETAIAELEIAVFEKAYVRLPEKGFRKVQEPWKDLKHLE